MELGPIVAPRENPLYRRLRGGTTPWRCIFRDSEPNTLPTELLRPTLLFSFTNQNFRMERRFSINRLSLQYGSRWNVMVRLKKNKLRGESGVLCPLHDRVMATHHQQTKVCSTPFSLHQERLKQWPKVWRRLRSPGGNTNFSRCETGLQTEMETPQRCYQSQSKSVDWLWWRNLREQHGEPAPPSWKQFTRASLGQS